ncbi:MAG: hypothetical protein NC419_05485 [Muribaculaceae bacterium]|nr:hypothetical protein [Muribaculaceae bacterium]
MMIYDDSYENVLTKMVEAANTVLEEKEITDKICLEICEKIPGGYTGVANIKNYYEVEDVYETYESLQNLYIGGNEHFNSSHGNKPSTYINLPDIKSLVVEEKIAQNAEEEGIDWYEVWPDLEYYKVRASCTVKNKEADDEISQAIYDRLGEKVYYCNSAFNENEEVLYYFYFVNDYEDENLLADMAETVNEKLKEDEINAKICIVIWERGAHTIASLSNYYEDGDGYELYETLQRLEIWGAHIPYEKYNEVSTFEKLKDIKAVVVERKINKSLEEQGVDWYEIWPDLEHYDIFYGYNRPGYPEVYWIP